MNRNLSRVDSRRELTSRRDETNIEIYHPDSIHLHSSQDNERALDDEIIAHINETIRKPHFSKFDIVILVLLWVISAWAIVADRLIADENEYMTKQVKYYISISIPIATSAVTALKSIQVAIEVKTERESAREAREAAIEAVIRARRNEHININLDTTPRRSCHRSTRNEDSSECQQDVENNDTMRPSMDEDMPRRANKPMFATTRFADRQCFSMPTIKIINKMPSQNESANHSKLVYCEDTYSSTTTDSTAKLSLSDEK